MLSVAIRADFQTDLLAADTANQDGCAPTSPQFLLPQGAQRMNINYFMQLTSIEHHEF